MRDGERLKKNLDELGYDAISLLSCMTLDDENLQSVVHHKSGVSTAFSAVCMRLWQYSEKEPQTNNSVVGLLLHKSWVVVPSPREIAGNV